MIAPDSRIPEPAARSFALTDQVEFARLSGDWNPMHVDPDSARRTQAGGCAVHGMHALLWSLDAMARAGLDLDALGALKVDFKDFVRLDAPVTLSVTERSGDRVRAELAQDGRKAVAIELGLGRPGGFGEAPPTWGGAPRALPAEPATADLEGLAGHAGELAPPDNASARAQERFPAAAAALGAEAVAGLGLLSALVGMVAPGLHSIFSGLALRLYAAPATGSAAVRYRVRRVDPRFRLAVIDVAGPRFGGSVNAFARFPPVEPPGLEALADRVDPDEFAGRRALVVGGSRGLGAITAKLVAAGGGSVLITYHRGSREAERIRDEIAAARGADRCRVARYDVARDPAAQLAAATEPFTHAYYFATGPIGHGSGTAFDRARFNAFVDAYVAGFDRLVRHLLAWQPGTAWHAFYPSSVFVAEPPRGMAEYAMAKAAGEILCRELARANRNLAIASPRLPRVFTDQTAAVPPVPAADPVEVMLPLLRQESAGRG